MKLTKKLIEVALPLRAISAASAYEKMPGIGAHPRGLHLWWARRPLAAARAIIFSQLVDDPSSYVDELLANPTTREAAENELQRRSDALSITSQDSVVEPSSSQPSTALDLEHVAAEIERKRLFAIIEELVQWKNSLNPRVIERARMEILRCWKRACDANSHDPHANELFNNSVLPMFHDPFSGGGALPLEAQRLGLISKATDLNPVAVLINKAMIEYPPHFYNRPPIHASQAHHSDEYIGMNGLARDVRYYGEWILHEATKRLGDSYPVEFVDESTGMRSKIVAWIWARTVYSPDPAFSHVRVPLVRNFVLCNKPKRKLWLKPIVDRDSKCIKYELVTDGSSEDFATAKLGTKRGQTNFTCLLSDTSISAQYIKQEAAHGRMGTTLLAVVTEGSGGKQFHLPQSDGGNNGATFDSQPLHLNANHSNAVSDSLTQFGIKSFEELFSPRQLMALSMLCELVREVRHNIELDFKSNASHLSNRGGGG